MLRRKLLLALCPLVILLVGTTAAAVWMLGRVLTDMEHVQNHASRMSEEVGQLGQAVTSIEVNLYELELGAERHLDPLIDSVESLDQLVNRLQENYDIQAELGKSGYKQIQAALGEFKPHIAALATTTDPALRYYHTRESLKSSVVIRREALALGEVARLHAQQERDDLVSKFRWLLLGLALVSLTVIDAVVLILWRTASMILRPVDRLIVASRELAEEHFDYRVALNGKDEFGELARAYNGLAERLQAHEQRKIEVLAQVAATLNHELNNALAIIELQLTVLQDSIQDHEDTRKCLRQIRENLERMARTIQSLKHIRRVVLTEYADGVKMLDLERSVRDEPPAREATLESNVGERGP
jgi:HAMP domain-containing protein